MNLVVVTGGGSGIGLAIAEKFLEKNWIVALVGRDKKKLQAVAERHPEGLVLPFSLDVSKPLQDQGEWADFERLVLKNSNLSSVINSAGYYKVGSFNDASENSFLDHYNVNVMGVVRMVQAAWPYLLKRERAFIVNIGSTLGLRPVAGTAAYSSSKAALQNLTETLALEGAPRIRVNTICPGIVETPIHSFYHSQTDKDQQVREMLADLHPLHRLGKPEDIAPWVYHLCSEDGAWITGSCLKIDGGIHLTSKG